MNKESIKIFLLGAIVALLAVAVLKSYYGSNGNMLLAADSGTGNGLIVVTMGSDNEEILVVDSVNHRMAVYDYDSSKIKLKAARNMEYDLKIEKDLSDRSGLSYDEIKKMATGRR